jgi:primosomal protein N' (replication factor Y)
VPAILPVLLPLPLPEPFDYLVGEGDMPCPGAFVRVPFGPRESVGVVWDRPGSRPVPRAKLKPIIGGLEAPAIPPLLRRFAEVVAAETLVPLGTVLRLMMSVPAALEPETPKIGYRLAAGPEASPAGKVEARVVAALAEAAEPMAGAALAKAARASAAVLRRMADRGLLEVCARAPDEGPAAPDLARPGLALDAAQTEAAASLWRMVRGGAGVCLLDGVPGSGKTEVYFEAVAECLRLGRRVLVLLPEIALSTQWLDRFVRRFGVEPVLWHSGLSPAQRRRRWRWIAEGRASVVVGARSALFLPLTDLGLLVVDEEHDTSFKQEEGAIYHARDMALRRARLEGCVAVLASATPSLETALAAGAIAGEPAEPGWRHLRLPSRFGAAAMPDVRLVDLRRERPPRGAFLSPPLRERLAAALAEGGQSLLFLNRRGYAPLALCRACGHRLRCPNCSAWLTAHRLRRRLMCHHCGYSQPEPEHCPACGSVDSVSLSGPGVERVAEEVRALLPEARVAVMTSDTVGTARAAEDLVRAMAAREIDVLVGTQMVAKGHHFPDLVLVGVVDADLALQGGDLRAGERTFQLLYQVAGRAGREGRAGQALVQTHLPEHPVMQALVSGDRDRFLAVEMAEREAAEMPPFGRLASLVVSGPDSPRVKAEAQRLAREAPLIEGITILGPAPAPLALLRGRWRERILIKAAAEVDLPGWLGGWVRGWKLAAGVDLAVDIDPQSFL